MKMKKLVSALSALAMTVTAMAGLAVTANAAEGDITISANYFNSSATDYVNDVDGWTADNGNVTVEWIEGTGVRMSTGKTPGTNGMSKDLGTSYSGIITGSFLWNVGTSTGKNNNYNSLKVTDDGGTTVFEVRSHGQSGTIEVIADGVTKDTGNDNTQYVREAEWEIDYTFNTVTKALTVSIDPNIGTESWSYNDLTSSAANVSKFATAWLRDGGGDSSYNVVKSYSMTVTPYTLPAGALTVNYRTEDGTSLGSATPDVSGNQAGDTFKYAYPKYIANGADLYKMTAGNTRADISLTAAEQSVDVTYAVDKEGQYYFYEFDGIYTTRADAESNGSAKTGSATLTVPVDGKYIVTANCYGSAAGRSATVTAGDVEIVSSTPILIWAGGTDLVSAEVELKADTQITVETSDSKSAIDYVILQKTGELPAPEPEVTEATAVEVPDATGVKAFMVEEFALDGTAPTWTITATPAEGEPQTNTVAADIPTVEAQNVNLGLIVDNVPETVTVTATLGY